MTLFPALPARGWLLSILIATASMPAAGANNAQSSANDQSKTAGTIVVGQDYHSYANPDVARVEHLDLDIAVDFDSRTLSGSADLRVVLAPGAQELRLDTRDLEIRSVALLDGGEQRPLTHTLAPVDKNLGSALSIDLPADLASPATVRVSYRTDPGAAGLQWLKPAQTAGKKLPFLFTQSQAIQARSWIPLQDTPAVRMTYNARVKTPPELLAVMSAANEPDTPRDGDYSFTMPQAIPSYLIALGVGDLKFQAMSDRTGVFAESALLADAANEFADTEKMLKTSEALFGPYRWGRYDLLILPPSFPFGGMENPRLSFITPTVIAGDRSLVALIAHELAHSWSGNLVTNATWRDLWLNEGFTSFLTSRIMEAVYGERRAQMEYFLDYQRLKEELASLPAGDQILAVDLRGRDPDDVFSRVPYVKGHLFLTWLEQRFGRERFDKFLRNYFDAFAFQSITTDAFLAFLDKQLLAPYDVVTMAEVNAWVFEPGLPDNAPQPYSDAFERIDKLEAKWLAGELALSAIDSDAWSVHEWLYFLNNLAKDLSPARMVELDEAFDLTASGNNEIAHSWLLLAIRRDYRQAWPRLEDYLVSIGRRKLIQPLYEELMKSDAGAEFAKQVYAKARPGYHPLAVSTMDDIVNPG